MLFPDLSASSSRAKLASSPPSKSLSRPTKRPSKHRPPSKFLLSLLATVVADTTAATAAPAPFPLTFLYPSFQVREEPQSSRYQVRAGLKKQRRNRFPELYTQGADGRWRRAERYMLYGSTMCTNCDAESSEIPQVNEVSSPVTVTDAQITPSTSNLTTPSPLCGTNNTEFADCLPLGWGSTNTRSNRTAVILTISLVLAFFICFFIIGCLLWRKSMRKMKDVEQSRKRQKKKNREEDAQSMLEKQMRSQKIWARATARWKANAHHSAWKRRGRRRALQQSEATSSSQTAINADSTLNSQRSSPHASRRSSLCSTRSSSPTPSQRSTSSRREASDRSSMPPPPSRPPTPPSASPPAYHHPNRSHSELTDSEQSLHPTSSKSRSDNISGTQHRETSLHHSLQASSHSGPVPSDDQVDIPYTLSLNSGHLATDDKAILQRLTEQASAPPSEEDTQRVSISAPVWHDEDAAEFPQEPLEGHPSKHHRPPASGSHHPLFPPLPATTAISEKGKMAEYFNYEYTFEEDVHSSTNEPSAPPFESFGDSIPSAPPLDYGCDDALEYVDEPTAPPLGMLEEGGDKQQGEESPDEVRHAVDGHDSRRDSSLQRLGLDFDTPTASSSSSPTGRDSILPLYRP